MRKMNITKLKIIGIITAFFTLASITPSNAFLPFFKKRLVPQLELPKKMIALLHYIKPYLQETGRIQKNADTNQLIAKLTPTSSFDGDGVLSLITQLEEAQDTPENKKKLHKIQLLYYKLFRRYIFSLPGHRIPEQSRALIGHTTRMIYHFGEYTDANNIVHGSLRLPLTKLIIKIFKLKKPQQDNGFQDQLDIKRTALFKALSKFEKQTSTMLKNATEKDKDDAKKILNNLNSYILTLQQYAIDLAWWKVWLKYLKIAGVITGAAFSAFIGWKIYKSLKKVTDPAKKVSEKINKKIDEIDPFIKPVAEGTKTAIDHFNDVMVTLKANNEVTLKNIFGTLLEILTDGSIKEKQKFALELTKTYARAYTHEKKIVNEAFKLIPQAILQEHLPVTAFPMYKETHKTSPLPRDRKAVMNNVASLGIHFFKSLLPIKSNPTSYERKDAKHKLKEWLKFLETEVGINHNMALAKVWIDKTWNSEDPTVEELEKARIEIEKLVLEVKFRQLKAELENKPTWLYIAETFTNHKQRVEQLDPSIDDFSIENALKTIEDAWRMLNAADYFLLKQ
jgi:hypothetical protein